MPVQHTILGRGRRATKKSQTGNRKSGGIFTGSISQGEFQAKTPIGSIRGSYQIEGQEIALAITKSLSFFHVQNKRN